MDPVTFQLLSNAEILAVAVLHRYYLGKILTLKQWMSLILLIDGVVSAELAGSKKLSAAGASGVSSAGVVQAVDSTRGAFKGGADDDFWENVTKYSMVLCVALLRAFGGVGSEVAMKSTQDTLAFQNSHIYAWGVLSNIIFLAMHHGMMDVSLTGLEHLWHESSQNKGLWILLIVLNNSGQGLTVSVVFKYLNNIVKVYINSVALVLTTCISVYIFEFKVSGE
jgi:drug/metabolite transporter (DMT)-like permease